MMKLLDRLVLVFCLLFIGRCVYHYPQGFPHWWQWLPFLTCGLMVALILFHWDLPITDEDDREDD